MTSSERNKTVVIGFLEMVARGDMEAAIKCFAENATFWVPGTLPFSGTLRGRQEIMDKNFRPSMELSVPGTMSVEVGTVIAEGEHVAAEWVFKRKTRQGKDYVNHFFGLFHLENGEIQSFREYLDTLYAKEMLWKDS